MAAFKNKENGTWYVQFRYTDWRGERQQKLKRGFSTKKAALAWERALRRVARAPRSEQHTVRADLHCATFVIDFELFECEPLTCHRTYSLRNQW